MSCQPQPKTTTITSFEDDRGGILYSNKLKITGLNNNIGIEIVSTLPCCLLTSPGPSL